MADGMHTPIIENFYKATNLPEDIVNEADIGVRIIHGAKNSLSLYLSQKNTR